VKHIIRTNLTCITVGQIQWREGSALCQNVACTLHGFYGLYRARPFFQQQSKVPQGLPFHISNLRALCHVEAFLPPINPSNNGNSFESFKSLGSAAKSSSAYLCELASFIETHSHLEKGHAVPQNTFVYCVPGLKFLILIRPSYNFTEVVVFLSV